MELKPLRMMKISITVLQPNGTSINPSLLSTFQCFWNSGYEAFTADNMCRPIHPNEKEEIAMWRIGTIHSENFLFIEKGKK